MTFSSPRAGEKPTTATSAPNEKLTNANSQSSIKPSYNIVGKSSVSKKKFENI